MAASEFHTKLAKNNRKIISQQSFSQKFHINYFLVLAAAFLKVTPLQDFCSFCLSLNMSGIYRTQPNIKMEPFAKIVNSSRGIFKMEYSKFIFRVQIKHYQHFEGVTPKEYYTLFHTSSNTDIFRQLLSNNTHFSRAYIKQYSDIFKVTGKQYCTLFQSLHQTILTFSESYWQTTPQTFPEFILSNNDIFRKFL